MWAGIGLADSAGDAFACAVVAPALIAAACSGSPAAPSPASSGSGDAAAYSAELSTCVQVTNMYRTSVGKAALTRSAALDEYAAAAARTDGTVKIAHHHARTTISATASPARKTPSSGRAFVNGDEVTVVQAFR